MLFDSSNPWRFVPIFLTLIFALASTVQSQESSIETPVDIKFEWNEWTRAPHGRGNIYAPELLCVNDTWWMYFGGQGTDGHDRILRATSKDRIHWTDLQMVFFPPEVNHVNDPSIVRDGSTYYMFYTRATQGVTDTIGLATSQDGLLWNDQGTVLGPGTKGSWDALLVGRPSVLLENGRWRMWYDGRETLPLGAPDKTAPQSAQSTRCVGYAESSDGITWTKHSEPLLSHDEGGLHVIRWKELLWMAYESRNGTQLAISQDGLRWKHHSTIGKDSVKSPHGHVTPFLLPSSTQIEIYYGAAMGPHWNENRLQRLAIPWKP